MQMERTRVREILVSILCVGTSCYVLATNMFLILPPFQERSLFMLLVILSVFLHKPFAGSHKYRFITVDILLLIATTLCFGYVFIQHEAIILRAGLVSPLETALAVLAVIIVLEAGRRMIGRFLPAIAIVALVYAFLGQYIPYQIGGHGGFSFERIVTYVYLSFNGIFGLITYVLFRYVFIFIIFGKLLEASGVLQFIMNFAMAVAGRVSGGPAIVAALASGAVGSVTGSAAANVMITGTATIPLMKKVGLPPHFAGGCPL